MASLDAFVDHEAAFLRYLEGQAADTTAASLGLGIRQAHSVHPKVGKRGSSEPRASLIGAFCFAENRNPTPVRASKVT